MSISNAPKRIPIEAHAQEQISAAHAAQSPRRRPQRLPISPELEGVWGSVVFGLVLVACALFALSLWQPWWLFKLYAPQYPRGLTLAISLTGLSGDVREIDMLNHYIGMAQLDAAAALERKYAAHAVVILCLFVVGVTLFSGRRWSRSSVVAGALFPIGFVVDSAYWLHRFGHALDRRAPLHIPQFTPQLFGNGNIGQFMTFARPELGFWLANLGVLCLFAAVIAREYACTARQRGRTVSEAGVAFDPPGGSKPG